QAMAIGTAGFTAMLAVIALERHGLGTAGEVLVTGAAGGVGGGAPGLLAELGPRTGAPPRPGERQPYLAALGAAGGGRRARAAARRGARGRRERRGRRHYPGDDPDPAQIPRQRRGLRSRRRQRAAGDGDPVPAAWGQSARHRFGDVPAGAADRSLAAPRRRPA